MCFLHVYQTTVATDCFQSVGFYAVFSWYLPVNHGVWFTIDKSIFYWFNDQLVSNRLLSWVIAITNFRDFDGVALLAMGVLYFCLWHKAPTDEKWRIFVTGVAMVISAIILNQLGHLIPVSHPSPTKFFSDVHHVTQLTGIATKDASSDSFPRDHGMLLMIFASYMLRYFSLRFFSLSVAIVLIFASPRIMIGAHWFTDVAVGSLSIVLVGMSWWLLTPACDKMIALLYRYTPAGHRQKKNIA
ncbi:MAG: Lipid A 1-diphosphate synthase [Candidatus Erwinia impunctatus]|nr:Lipid A 1-diphosphate synthase [Culicoides impunctatus]